MYFALFGGVKQYAGGRIELWQADKAVHYVEAVHVPARGVVGFAPLDHFPADAVLHFLTPLSLPGCPPCRIIGLSLFYPYRKAQQEGIWNPQLQPCLPFRQSFLPGLALCLDILLLLA